MYNFAEIASLLDARKAWDRIEDADGLAATWSRWLEDPSAARELGARAEEVLAQNRGATHKSLELIAPLLKVVNEPTT